MKNKKAVIIIGMCLFLIIFGVAFKNPVYVEIDFKYVYRSTNSNLADDIYPVWTLISTEDNFNKLPIAEKRNLDFDKYNFIVCQGGTISKIRCNMYEYLFEDKQKAYVFVKKTDPYDVYVYKIKKINLIHDLLSAPTTILR